MSLPVSSPSAPVAHTNPLLKTGKADVGDKKFSFWDLIDVVNPLQHIPVVNNIYRSVTGDEISNAARIAGGALFGGIIGAAIGGINAIAVNETGNDIGEMAMIKTGLKDPVQEAAKAPAALPENKSFENIPIIEVHPLAKNDAPKIENDINVEAPVEVAAAMPSPKELNELTPGTAPDLKVENAKEKLPVATPVTPEPEKVDVQKNMLQALAKYEMMQKTSAPIGMDKTITAENKHSSSGFNKLRHY